MNLEKGDHAIAKEYKMLNSGTCAFNLGLSFNRTALRKRKKGIYYKHPLRYCFLTGPFR